MGSDDEFPRLIMIRAGWSSPKNQLRISEAPFEEPEIPMCEALTIPFPWSFDTKKIFYDKKKMQTAVGTVFPAIETIASTIEAMVFPVEITICGTRIYSQKRNPFSTHLRSVFLLRRRPATKRRRRLRNPNKSIQAAQEISSARKRSGNRRVLQPPETSFWN